LRGAPVTPGGGKAQSGRSAAAATAGSAASISAQTMVFIDLLPQDVALQRRGSKQQYNSAAGWNSTL
jgi:hypothetical protein